MGCTKLKFITIPSSVKVIDNFAFYGCSGLKSVYYGSTKTNWKSISIGEYNEPLTKAKRTYSASAVAMAKQPSAAVNVAKGKTASVTVSATGEGLTYKWYFKDKGDSKFTLTKSFTGKTYSLTMTSSRSGRQVYCVIKDKYGNSIKTSTVTFGMSVSVSKQPASVGVASGKTARVSFTASGDGLTYKWYYKNKGDSKFTLAKSFTGKTYSIKMTADRSGRQVYCVITDKYGNSVKTKTVTLGIQVSISKQPVSVKVASGKKATVSVSALGEGLTYKWYFKDSGAKKFSLTSSFKGDSYSVTMSKSRSGRQAYCVITDAFGNSVKTKTVTLKVK